ncbi:HNH endonuclease [Actinomadura viridis]|nr:HNH endonuclease signature motif containing protein [Actinomadura viridis]
MPAELVEVVSGEGEWEGRGWFPPGPALGVCLSGGRERLGDLTDSELLEVAAAAHRQAAWAQSRELAAIAELSRRRAEEGEEDAGDPRVLSSRESVTEEVASTLTVTGNAAATLVHLAERLAVDLPGTREALEAGRIDLPKARVICDLSEGLPEGVVRRVEEAVIGRACGQTTGQLRRRIRRIVQRLAPEAIERRRSEAVARRRLEVWDTASGTADLGLLDLAPEEAHGIYNKITAVAAGLRSDGDVRPLNLIRADLAKTLLQGAELPEAVRALLTSAPALSGQDGQHLPPSPVNEGEQPPPSARLDVDDQSALAGHADKLERPAPVQTARLGVSELLTPAALTSVNERPAPISQTSDDRRSPAAHAVASGVTRWDGRPAPVSQVDVGGRSHTARACESDLPAPAARLGDRPGPVVEMNRDGPSPAASEGGSALPAAVAHLDGRPGPAVQVTGGGRSPTASVGEVGVPAPVARPGEGPVLMTCVMDADEWVSAAIPVGGAFTSAGVTGPGGDLVGVRALAGMVDRRLTGVLNRARALGRLEELPQMIGRAVRDIHDRLATAREAHCQGGADRHGHPGYRPPAVMRREVEDRHPTCVFPTCNIRSSRCDLDHTTPWSPGITCACNLAPLCRRHHRTKQTRGWKLTQIWPGLLIWITPSGAWHITLPNRE